MLPTIRPALQQLEIANNENAPRLRRHWSPHVPFEMHLGARRKIVTRSNYPNDADDHFHHSDNLDSLEGRDDEPPPLGQQTRGAQNGVAGYSTAAGGAIFGIVGEYSVNARN
jgi:hypothetical protein